MSKVSDASLQDDWRAKDDMRTLASAEEIKKDPKRYKAAIKEAKLQIKNLEEAFPDAESDD